MLAEEKERKEETYQTPNLTHRRLQHTSLNLIRNFALHQIQPIVLVIPLFSLSFSGSLRGGVVGAEFGD